MHSTPKQSTGFTLIELVMTIIILGILAVTALPKFWDNKSFDAYGFSKQTLATLRYAQKTAIVQHRLVCVNLTASTPATITLTITDTNICDTPLKLPASSSHILTAPSGISLSPATSINFDALGSTNPAASITITNVTNPIIVEAETGYVHQ